jgi:hypothetical protein
MPPRVAEPRPCLCSFPPAVVEDSYDAIDAALAEINTAILRMQHYRSDLLQRRNALSASIFRLPAEVLLSVFEHVANRRLSFEDASHIQDWMPYEPHPVLVMKLSHVSRTFRELACQTATLWVAPRVGGQSNRRRDRALRMPACSVEYALSRAAPVPLCIVDDSIPSVNIFTSSPGLHLATIRHLWIRLDERLCAMLAPLLRSCTLKTLHVDLEECSARRLIVDTPTLSTFSTYDVGKLSPELLHLPKVRKMALDAVDYAPEDMDQWLAIIARAPNLSELVISAWDRHERTLLDDVALQPARTLAMPHLRTIRLLGDIDAVLILARVLETALHVPSPLHIHIGDGRSGTGTVADIDAVLRFVRHRSSPINHSPVSVILRANNRLRDSYVIRFYDSTLHGVGSLSLKLGFNLPLYDPNDGNNSLFRAVNWHRVKNLSIGYLPARLFGGVDCPWYDLRTAPALETLEVDSSTRERTAALLQALTPRPSDPALPFSSLRSFCLGIDRAETSVCAALSSVLELRAARGLRLSTLRVSHRDISADSAATGLSLLSLWVQDVQVTDITS